MQKIEILILEEDDMMNGHAKQSAGDNRVLWTADQAILRKKDGTVEVLKDRWDCPSNNSRVEICLS